MTWIRVWYGTDDKRARYIGICKDEVSIEWIIRDRLGSSDKNFVVNYGK